MKVQKLLAPLFIAGGFLYFSLREPPPPAQIANDPQGTLIELVRSVKSGEIDRIVSSFSGDLRTEMQALVDREGPAFREWLQARQHLVKGFAIVNQESLGPDRVKLFTETVYEDKKTKQVFELGREKGAWKIVATDSELVTPWSGRRSVFEEPVDQNVKPEKE